MEFAISQPKMAQLPQNEKQTYQLNSRPQMRPSCLTLAMTLALNFQGQIWNLLYISQKWPDCHETNNKYNDWNLGLKCDHQIWPWPWPWPWIFRVKYGICYISTKSGLTAMKQGSHRVWKTWINNIFWKKSWNFEKSSKVMEKSWNLENPTPINHPPALEIWHW